MKQVVLFVLAAFIVAGASAQPLVKYVTQNGAGLKNGSSWSNAWNDSIFAANLHLQPAGTEVWVAKGIYRPSDGFPGSLAAPPTYTFLIPSGVKLYGGFDGTENNLTDRMLSLTHSTNKTKLTGLLNISDPFWQNRTGYVVNMTGCEKLDGFTISDGFVSGVKVVGFCSGNATAAINNCIIQDNGAGGDNNAGGITVSSTGAHPIGISNCFIAGNRGASSGGITCADGKINLLNCVFAKNLGAIINFPGPSSAIYFLRSSGSITNCTFVGNNTNPYSGLFASENASDSIYINNSILWGNYELYMGYQPTQSPYHIRVVSGSNKFSIKNSLYQPVVVSMPGTIAGAAPAVLLNSFGNNPFLVNETSPAGADNQWGTADDGLNLTACSPALNVGNNAIVNGAGKDILGNNRIFGSQVDLGAYELQQPATTGITVQQQPVSIMLTPADTARFSITATGGTLGYQWQQYNLSNGWINLLNDTVYSGVTTAQLTISKLYSSLSGQGQQFRCLVNNQYCNGYISNAAKLFVRQPILKNLCPNSNGTLLAGNISYPPENKIFQWQVDTGINGYRNIFNSTHYSGTNTISLQLINIPSAWYGYKYRCYELNNDEYGDLHVLKFTNTWRGTVNNSWENPANWSCGQVPDANTDVTIGTTTIAGSTYPSNITVGANSICRSLTVLPGGNTVTVLPGFTLTVVH